MLPTSCLKCKASPCTLRVSLSSSVSQAPPRQRNSGSCLQRVCRILRWCVKSSLFTLPAVPKADGAKVFYLLHPVRAVAKFARSKRAGETTFIHASLLRTVPDSSEDRPLIDFNIDCESIDVCVTQAQVRDLSALQAYFRRRELRERRNRDVFVMFEYYIPVCSIFDVS